MAIFKTLLAATALFNVAFSGTTYSSEVAPVVTSIQLVTSVTFVAPTPASSSTHCNTLTVTEVAPPSTVTVIAPPPGVSGTGAASSSKPANSMTIQTSTPSSIISKVLRIEPCTHTVTSNGGVIVVGCHLPSSPSSNTSKILPTETCVNTVTHDGQVLTVTGCLLPPGLSPPTVTATKSTTEIVTLPSTSAIRNTSVVYGTANFTGTAITGSAIMPSMIHSNTFHMNSTKTATATGTGGTSASATYTAPFLPPFTDAADATNVGAAVLFGGVLMALFGA